MSSHHLQRMVLVLDALGEGGLSAELARALAGDDPEALRQALLKASDVMRQDDVPAVAELGESCCRMAAELGARAVTREEEG